MNKDIIYVQKKNKLFNMEDAIKEKDAQLYEGKIINESDGFDYSYHGSPNTETIYKIQGADNKVYTVSDKDDLALNPKNKIEFIPKDEFKKFASKTTNIINLEIEAVKKQLFELENQRRNIQQNAYIFEHPLPKELIEKANQINSGMDCGTRTLKLFKDEVNLVFDHVQEDQVRNIALSNFYELASKELTDAINEANSENARINNWRNTRNMIRTYASVIYDTSNETTPEKVSEKIIELGDDREQLLVKLNDISVKSYGGESIKEFEVKNFSSELHITLECFTNDLSGLKDHVDDLNNIIQEKYDATGQVPETSLSLKVNGINLIDKQSINILSLSNQLREGKLDILDALKNSINDKVVEKQIDYLQEQMMENIDIIETAPIAV